MKKFAISTLILCLLLLASACTPTQTEPTQPDLPATEATVADDIILAPGEDLFYGLILSDLGDTLLVTENKTEGKTAGLYTLPEKYLDATQDAGVLVPGTYFTLRYNGTVIETYPACFEVCQSFVCDETKEDFVAPILRVVLANIPADAPWVGLDLSGVSQLSAGECEAICYLASNKLADQCSVVRFDAKTMDAQELLTGENSPAGVVILGVTMQTEGDTLTGTWYLRDAENTTEGTWESSLSESN